MQLFEEFRFHMLAPSSTPFGAGFSHQSESGIGHNAFNNSWSNVGQLPPEEFP